MRFRLLGPLEVTQGVSPLPIRAGRQRAVLAALLVDANRMVPLDVLVARVWDGDPPGRTALHNLIMRLRQTLGATVIRTRSDGYLIEVAETDLDLRHFDALVQRAKAATDPGRVSALLTEALALWRGEPLADVPSERLRREVVPGLLERKLAATEQRVEADLALGRHHDLVAELRELTDRHPLREHFWGQLMLALDGSGRQAEALECYRRVAKVLAEELGIDPGPALREVRQRILTGPAPLPTSDAQVPRQLPRRTPHFVGRAAELAALTRFRGLTGETVVISAINGGGGIGKTTLAVHWAHESRAEFPDGQLYVNLRGFDGKSEPMDPAEAVRGFLDAFAVPPDRIPAGLDAQAALYRGLLADRRVLVVLDNARDADQVRPLLPASPTCLVLVTSRAQLTGLVAREGARPIPLDLLSTAEATDLLTHHLGRDRVAAEPEAVAELVDRCAHLPLAVALMAARAAVNPRLGLRALADDLRDERTRLDALDSDDPANGTRAVFSYSYRRLSPPAARLFRLLGTAPGPDISFAAAASLAGLSAAEVRPVLEELVTARLVGQPTPTRLALHDLLRAYAAEQHDDERHDATRRLLDHYLHTALAACARLYPHRIPLTPADPAPGTTPEEVAGPDQALAWYGAEHHVLPAAVDLAAATGFDRHAHRLAWSLASYLNQFGHHHEWARTQRVAISAAERVGDDDSRAEAHISLGQACGRAGDFTRAHAELSTALTLYLRLGNAAGQAAAHGSLAWACRFLDRHEDYLEHSLRSAELYRITGRKEGECRALNAIAFYYIDLGDYERSLVHGHQALAIAEEVGDLDSEANLRDTVGVAYHRLGDHVRAVEHLRRAASLCVEHCSHDDQVTIFGSLGDALHASGDPAEARQAWQRALDLAKNLPGADVDQLRAKLRGS
ncbi:BTAD domain-containing putative transcriptional regulator [Umezawaea endophytica]|uniref:Tetratricopeptide repeat protein n=1 Tax=Umezawaea endophytica TaxID=1654476 RepID=A0A9X2VMU0_9PSEU|nr:BTAD domain-containing putative transcriptional regulator [Umezawaea endophytica]MCS7478912.1 tetratricopeptide repeat protein [Umezawaea endophytica]